MGFLKKIRSNILNQRNSFHIGFRNRSPFSYRGEYAGDWTPEVPNLASSAYGQPETDLGEIDLLKTQIETIGKVEGAITDALKTKMETEGDPYSESKRLEKRAQGIGDRADKALNKGNIKRGDRLAQKSEDILKKSTETWQEEDKIIKGKAAQKAAYKKNNPNASYAEFDCVINQSGSWDSTTNTCN